MLLCYLGSSQRECELREVKNGIPSTGGCRGALTRKRSNTSSMS